MCGFYTSPTGKGFSRRLYLQISKTHNVKISAGKSYLSNFETLLFTLHVSLFFINGFLFVFLFISDPNRNDRS